MFTKIKEIRLKSLNLINIWEKTPMTKISEDNLEFNNSDHGENKAEWISNDEIKSNKQNIWSFPVNNTDKGALE